MSDISDILSSIPMDQLAARLGVDQATAESATRQALPALVGGLQANAQDPGGAQSLAGALGEHDNDLLDGGVNLDQVNTADGAKIVDNIFGAQQEQVAHTLGSQGGGGQGELIQKLLPILAPIVLSYLAKRLGASSGGSGLLGSILGGAGSGASGGTAGNPMGDLLCQILGRGGPSPLGGGTPTDPSITDILGGLLGGGRRA